MLNFHKSTNPALQNQIFSIIIPTWNNFEMLKLCVKSILQNSSYAHQIVLHINEGSDGTLEWAQEQNLDYSYSKKNVGICVACNAAYTLAKTDYILYMNDDMYACPEWDKNLYEAIKKYGKNDFYFSSTQIERDTIGWAAKVTGKNYGDSVENFEEERLLKEYKNLAIADWQGASIPPSVMHRNYWNLIGGFSIEFNPGLYSDPDMSRKLWAVGVRKYKGVGNSLVYHFMSKSLFRIELNPGHKQFVRKWGISARNFYDNYLHFPTKTLNNFEGILPEPKINFGFKLRTFIDKLKMF